MDISQTKLILYSGLVSGNSNDGVIASPVGWSKDTGFFLIVERGNFPLETVWSYSANNVTWTPPSFSSYINQPITLEFYKVI